MLGRCADARGPLLLLDATAKIGVRILALLPLPLLPLPLLALADTALASTAARISASRAAAEIGIALLIGAALPHALARRPGRAAAHAATGCPTSATRSPATASAATTLGESRRATQQGKAGANGKPPAPGRHHRHGLDP